MRDFFQQLPLLSLVLLLVVYTQSNAQGSRKIVDEAQDSSNIHYAGFTHIIQQETLYYLSSPYQARTPEGRLPAGTRVMVLRKAGSHSFVRTEGNIEAYVANDSLKEGLTGLMSVEPLWHVLRDSKVRIRWIYSDGLGWVVVHIDDNGFLGKKIGHTHLESGWNTDLSITLDPVPTSSTKVWAVYYVDKGITGKFEASGVTNSRDFCQGPDRPLIICRYNLGFLPDACLRQSLPMSECQNGLPLGTFMFTAVP